MTKKKKHSESRDIFPGPEYRDYGAEDHLFPDGGGIEWGLAGLVLIIIIYFLVRVFV